MVVRCRHELVKVNSAIAISVYLVEDGAPVFLLQRAVETQRRRLLQLISANDSVVVRVNTLECLLKLLEIILLRLQHSQDGDDSALHFGRFHEPVYVSER